MDGPVRIACFGDSLTEGYGLSPDEALPPVLERLLAERGYLTECLNFGVSGDTSGDGLRRIGHVLDSRPDCVILEFGANDCFVGDDITHIQANFDTLISELKNRDMPILLVGIAALPELGADYKATFDPLFKKLASKHDLPLYPDILASYYDNPALKLMDDTHPNSQGVEAIARDLLPHVVELIDSLTR